MANVSSVLRQVHTAPDYETATDAPVVTEAISAETRAANEAASTWTTSYATGTRLAPIDLTDDDLTIRGPMQAISNHLNPSNRYAVLGMAPRDRIQYLRDLLEDDDTSASSQSEDVVNLVPRLGPVKRNLESALEGWNASDAEDSFSHIYKRPQHSSTPASFHHFFELPTELRTLILEQYADMHDETIRSSPTKILKLRPVCKQLASEAEDLYVRLARLPENKKYTELKLHPRNNKWTVLDGILSRNRSGLSSVIRAVVVDIVALLNHDGEYIPKVTKLLRHLPNLTGLTIDHVMVKDTTFYHMIPSSDAVAAIAGLNPIRTALDLAKGTKISEISIFAPHSAFEIGNYLSRYNFPQLTSLTSLTITLTCPAPNGLLQDNTPHFSSASALSLCSLLRSLPKLEHLSLLRNCSRTISGPAPPGISHVSHPCFDHANSSWIETVISTQAFPCLESLTLEGFLLKQGDETLEMFERWNLEGCLKALWLKHCAVESKKVAGPWAKWLRDALSWESLKGLGRMWTVKEGYWTEELLMEGV